VGLTLGSRVLRQRIVVESRGAGQDRRRHFDRVVERQRADHPARRIGNPGEPAAECRTGRKFDVFDQHAHDSVEQVDLVVGKAARTVDEEIGDAPQQLGALRNILAREHPFELVDQVFRRVHDQATFRARGITASRSSSECGTGRPNR
jgi:hypothetical protein